jgi:uncharacterized protein
LGLYNFIIKLIFTLTHLLNQQTRSCNIITSILSVTLLFVISLIANTLSSLAGGGAGLLQLPILLFLGLPFAMALATHKVASVALGVGASIKHIRSGQLNWRFSLLIFATGVPGVITGALLVLELPEFITTLALSILTISLGIYSILKPQLGQKEQIKTHTTYSHLMGGFGLFCIGVLNGSLTSGTGLFVTLWLVGWYGLDYKKAVAFTLVLVGLFWNGSGAITLALQTDIYWPWIAPLLLASFIGGYLGAHLGQTKGNKTVKRAFEFVTIATGLSLLAKVLI